MVDIHLEMFTAVVCASLEHKEVGEGPLRPTRVYDNVMFDRELVQSFSYDVQLHGSLWRPVSLSRFSLLKHAKPSYIFFTGKVFSVGIAHCDACQEIDQTCQLI